MAQLLPTRPLDLRIVAQGHQQHLGKLQARHAVGGVKRPLPSPAMMPSLVQ